jgi:hypothetical protein
VVDAWKPGGEWDGRGGMFAFGNNHGDIQWDKWRYKWDILYNIYTVTTFKYVEGGPDREALEVV